MAETMVDLSPIACLWGCMWSITRGVGLSEEPGEQSSSAEISLLPVEGVKIVVL